MGVEVSLLEARGDDGSLARLEEAFRERGAALGLEIDGGADEGFLSMGWLWKSGVGFPCLADAKAVLDLPGGAVDVRMWTLLQDLGAIAEFRMDGGAPMVATAVLNLARSQGSAPSLDDFRLWLESLDPVGSGIDPTEHLPRLMRLLSWHKRLAPGYGLAFGLSAMETLRRALPNWAPSTSLLPDTEGLRRELEGLPDGVFDGSLLFQERIGRDWFVAEALACLDWFDELAARPGAGEIVLLLAEAAGTEEEVEEFCARLADAAESMACSMQRRTAGGVTMARVTGRTANVLDDAMCGFVAGDDGREWPPGMRFIGDAVVASNGMQTGTVRFAKSRGKFLPRVVAFMQGEERPAPDFMDEWLAAVHGDFPEDGRLPLVRRLTAMLPRGNGVERAMALHALALVMTEGTLPDRETLAGLAPLSDLLPDGGPEFVMGGPADAEEIRAGARRCLALFEALARSGRDSA